MLTIYEAATSLYKAKLILPQSKVPGNQTAQDRLLEDCIAHVNKNQTEKGRTIMTDLMLFEKDGQYLADSREVAFAVEKEHRFLLRDIRGYIDHLNETNFAPVDFFIENTYIDNKGETRPCYLCTKRGCDMIANKLTGKKGVLFTAAYVTAFDKMQNFIKEGRTLNSGVDFKELVESVELVAKGLNVNEAGKITMYNKLYKSLGAPTDFLPKYELSGNHTLKSATELLKQGGYKISAMKFNKKLIEHGLLEEKERPSSNGVKKFKSLSIDGLQYGENALNPHNQKETQPLYYENMFDELFSVAM